jgi:predicted nucleic acid-binding protein
LRRLYWSACLGTDPEPPGYSPGHADVMRGIELRDRYKISWWDALVVNSANELGCEVLWSEDMNHGQRYGGVTVRNPFL